MQNELTRCLSIYSNKTEALILSIDLNHVDIDSLKPHFDIGDDHDMLHSYELTRYTLPMVKPFIPKYVEINWANGELSAFLECYDRGPQ